jgi:RimJ/RimL family protein N-acetyltransferase
MVSPNGSRSRALRAYGDAGLTVIDGEVELGYKLRRSRWGRGPATEMARAWLVNAFGPLGLILN